MNRFGVLTVVALLITQLSFGQRITMIKTFGSVRYELGDTLTISPKQVSQILKDNNQVAFEEFKKSRSNSSVAGVLGFVGGFLIGFPIGTAIAGGEPEWGLAAAGGALILITIPISNASRRHAENALDEYNRKFTSRLEPRLFISGSGAGLAIRF